MIEPSKPQISYERLAKIFKVLTHPARVAILSLLRDGEQCVCHLVACLDYPQPYISQQLGVLREAEIVQDRREGWNIYYRVIDPHVFALLDAVEEIVDQEPIRIHIRKDQCTCPKCSAKKMKDKVFITEELN